MVHEVHLHAFGTVYAVSHLMPIGAECDMHVGCRQMRAQWTTGSASSAPIVQYGTSSGSYTNTTAGVSTHGYGRNELNGTTEPNYGIANSTGYDSLT